MTFADCPPRPGSLTPPPPCPQDLSMRKDSSEAPASSLPMVMPKTEYDPGPPVTSSHYSRHSPPPYPAPGHVKEEPREAPPGLPPGFPPYYLPDLAPHHLYRQSADPRLAPHHPPSSPPASPPRSHPPPPASNHYGAQHRPQFYPGLGPRAPGLPLSSLYGAADQGGHVAAAHAQYNMWNGGHDMGHVTGHVTMPTPGQNIWSRVTQAQESHNNHGTSNNVTNPGLQNFQNHLNNLKPCLDIKAQVKSESRLSTDSQDSLKKKARKLKPETSEFSGEHDSSLDGQPPKKKGKSKSKLNNKDPNAPKRVFVCPHCNVSIT